jgi:hypothetical protein
MFLAHFDPPNAGDLVGLKDLLDASSRMKLNPLGFRGTYAGSIMVEDHRKRL